MQTYLSKHWHRFPEEVWERLFDFERYGTVTVSELPDDLFIELARLVYESEESRMKLEIDRKEAEIEQISKTIAKYDWKNFDPPAVMKRQVLERLYEDIEAIEAEIKNLSDSQILSNPDEAFSYLKEWHRRYEVEESFAVNIIIQWHQALKELCRGDNVTFVHWYIKLVREFLHSRNLKYLLLENNGNIRLVFNPAVLFMEKVFALKEECLTDSNLRGMYEDFEEEMCELINGCSNRKAKTVLHSAFDLLEGSLKKAVSHNGTRSIKYLVNKELPNDYFPNDNAKQILIILNDFFNSYPGLRHSASAKSANRDLNNNDAVVFGGISALLSKYLLDK